MTTAKAKVVPKSDSAVSFDNTLKNIQHLISGGISGAIARTVTAPFERITILRQTRNPHYEGLSIPKILVKMAKQEGFLSYFKGNGANICRIFPYSAIELFTFEWFKHLLSSKITQFEGKSSALYFAAGTLAGMTASTFVYPLDVLRTLFAIQINQNIYAGFWSSWKRVIKNDGFLSLYRGLGLTLVGYAPYASMKLTFFQLMKNHYYQNGAPHSNTMNILFGGISGTLAVTIYYPVDLIRKRFQASLMKEGVKIKYLDLIQKIYAKHGFVGFYAGLAASYCKLIPATAITFGINEYLKKLWDIEHH